MPYVSYVCDLAHCGMYFRYVTLPRWIICFQIGSHPHFFVLKIYFFGFSLKRWTDKATFFYINKVYWMCRVYYWIRISIFFSYLKIEWFLEKRNITRTFVTKWSRSWILLELSDNLCNIFCVTSISKEYVVFITNSACFEINNELGI